MTDSNFNESSLDRATAQRLGRLGAMPVDTSRLDQALRARIPQPLPQRRAWQPWLRAAVAASVLVAVIAGALVLSGGGPVLASPAQMAQVHRDLVAGRVPVTQVDSIEEAGRVLAQAHPQTPDLPQAPEAHVMACCMKSIKDKRVACVLLRSENTPITLTVASADDMRLPTGPSIVRDGAAYHHQSFESLNMVMTQREGRWACLIGELPVDRLVELAAALRF